VATDHNSSHVNFHTLRALDLQIEPYPLCRHAWKNNQSFLLE
jgi:hypothetical protein